MPCLNTMVAPASAPPEKHMFRRYMGQISRQSGVFLAGTLLSSGAAYVFKIYLAHALGAEALGVYALGMTLVGLFGICNGLGLPQAATRFVAAYVATERWDELRIFLGRGLGLLLVVNLGLGGIFLLVGRWVAARFYHAPALTSYLNLFALIMALGALTSFLGQVLAGYKDVTRRTVITHLVGNPVMMAITVVLVGLGLGLWGYMAAQVAGASIVLFLLVTAVWRLTPTGARSGMEPLRRLDSEVVQFSGAVFGIGILEFLLSQADKILIGFYLNVRQVGIYAVAASLVAFVPVVLQSVNQIFSPTIADLHARGDLELLQRLFQTLTKWILGFTLPLAASVVVFAAPLMRMFGHDFESGWPILVIGVLGQLVNCGVGSVGFLLLMSGNQRRLIRVQVSMAVVMVALNLWLIPRWGIVGAAVAAALTNAAANAWYLREVREALQLSPYTRGYVHLLPGVAASVATLALLRLQMGAVRPEWVMVIAGMIASYAVFIAVVVGLGMSADDRLIATAIWARFRGTLQRAAVVAS